jgi:hypothetical protein
MADEVQAPEPLDHEEATKDSEAVKDDDARYIGVDPIYAQSAYEEPLEPKAAGRSKEDKEEVADELDMIERVRENEAGCVVNVDEPVPFEEWVEGTDLATRKAGVGGVDQKRREEARKTVEAVKDSETGRIPPSSGNTNQPGVTRSGG